MRTRFQVCLASRRSINCIGTIDNQRGGICSYERSASEKVKVTLFAGVENLFDRTYYENGFLAPGAVGRGGIKVRFREGFRLQG
jgi:hypothetical protein